VAEPGDAVVLKRIKLDCKNPPALLFGALVEGL